MVKKFNKWNILKILYVIAAFAFALPSYIYLIKNKSVYNLDIDYSFLINNEEKVKQTLIYVGIIIFIVILYFLILKFRKKLFKNIKSVLIFITIISLIFIFTVPMFSFDIFYYMGIGRLNSEYGQNPYYISMQEFVENNENINLDFDTILYRGYTNAWASETVVYGPIWTMICALLSKITFGNVDLCLLVFKLVNILVHIVNCYLIYKISKKKLFTLIYGLNPFILIQTIVDVHNDIFMVLFILLSLYALLKKKNIWLAVLFLAIATCIKYFAVLLLPFVIIYHFRKEKTSVKILKCIQYGLLLLMIILIPYMFYIRDLSVFSGMITQQSKYSKSIGVIIFKYFPGQQKIIKDLLYFFIYCFAIKNMLLLLKPKIKIRKELNHLFYFVFIFLFVLITNFQPWYILWLFPLVMWQKPKFIRLMIQISVIVLFDYIIFMIYEDSWQIGANFALILLGTIIFFYLIDNIKGLRRYIKRRKKEKYESTCSR